MNAAEMVQKAVDENPDIEAVLQIALRARETEARDLPREISVTSEVVAIPTNSQCAV
jgi:hypothetical protein